MTAWAFADPENTAVFTTRQVVEGLSPILLVTHDEDDGAWQFLFGTTDDLGDSRVVGLRAIVELDSSLVELADLPMGWAARREGPEHSWVRQRQSSEAD
tara:strand:+ start:7411 stop:7707 length:297 start_codon:yes stop_codon:yes gene_type:complete